MYNVILGKVGMIMLITDKKSGLFLILLTIFLKLNILITEMKNSCIVNQQGQKDVRNS